MTATLSRDRSRVTYQPALDGLRAVAVLAVLLYHHHRGGGFGRLGRGGFLGVDVFFVLSGYLITTILLHAQRSTGTIDLGRFWTRRARRLIPALLVLLVVAVVLGRSLYPDRQAALHQDLLPTLLYVENWHIALWHGSKLSPIAHTWSLSVEEQFYLVWPVAVMGLVALTRRRIRRMLPIVAGLAVLSAIWTSVALSGVRAYFGTDARAQELLVGAALATLTVGSTLSVPERFRTILDSTAVVLLIALVALLIGGPAAGAWEDGGLLVFAVGVALLITAAVQTGGPVRTILAAGPLAAIGRISYGLYLFHLPVFAWINDSSGITGMPLFFVRTGVTAALAWASYAFIERPIRNGWGSWRVLVPLGLAVVGVVFALGSTLAGPVPTPKSKLLDFSLRAAASRAPRASTHVLGVGGHRASLLNLAAGGATGAGTNWVVFVGTPGCGLTSLSPTCRAVPDDLAAIATTFRSGVVVLMPDDRDVVDAVADSGRGTRRVIARLDAIRRAVESRRVGLIRPPCGIDASAARAEFDAATTRWARQHRVAVAPSMSVDCRSGAAHETSIDAVRRSIDQLARRLRSR